MNRTEFRALHGALFCSLLAMHCLPVSALPARTVSIVRQTQRNLPMGTAKRVVVDGAGTIEIVPGPAAQVQVIATSRGWAADEAEATRLLESARWYLDADARHVRVRAEVPHMADEGAHSGKGRALDLRVLVPAGTNVQATTHHGGIQVRGMGATDLMAGMGAVAVRDLAGELAAQADHGRIRVDRVRGAVNLRTRTGSVYAGRIAGPLEVVAASGSIEASEISGNCRLVTRQGRITARAVGGSLTAEAQTGSLTLRQIAGFVEARTVHGRILADDLRGDWISLQTDAGGIQLRLPQMRADRITLQSRYGRIEAAVPLTADLRLDLSSRQGAVDCRLPLMGSLEENGPRRVAGTMGKGRSSLIVTTETGPILVRGN